MKTVLHVGCGRQPLPEWLAGLEEVRLDIDPDVQPDIVASMTDMGDIGPFDAVYTLHTLEHLYPQDVPTALGEIKRVLKPGGFAMIVVPDLEDVRPTEDVVYVSPAGPVSGLDMYYGMAGLIAESPYMAHHCGFVQETLQQVIDAAGFKASNVTRDRFNLLAAAIA